MKIFMKENKINVYNDRHVSLEGEVTNHVVLQMDNKKVTFKEDNKEKKKTLSWQERIQISCGIYLI